MSAVPDGRDDLPAVRRAEPSGVQLRRDLAAYARHLADAAADLGVDPPSLGPDFRPVPPERDRLRARR